MCRYIFRIGAEPLPTSEANDLRRLFDAKDVFSQPVSYGNIDMVIGHCFSWLGDLAAVVAAPTTEAVLGLLAIKLAKLRVRLVYPIWENGRRIYQEIIVRDGSLEKIPLLLR